jgi:hypothetical protein
LKVQIKENSVSETKLTVLEWAQERLANSLRIAALKSGTDREGWREDVDYWREIVSRLSLLETVVPAMKAQ